MESIIQIIDMVDSTKLSFQMIPDLSYSTESKVVAIAANGRNNPIYQYTGSENKLELEISWYATENDRKDVLRNCRWLEARAQANGWIDGMHELHIIFGQVFKPTDLWILSKVESDYTLPHASYGLVPTLAKQKLSFLRVAIKNRTHSQIGSV